MHGASPRKWRGYVSCVPVPFFYESVRRSCDRTLPWPSRLSLRAHSGCVANALRVVDSSHQGRSVFFNAGSSFSRTRDLGSRGRNRTSGSGLMRPSWGPPLRCYGRYLDIAARHRSVLRLEQLAQRHLRLSAQGGVGEMAREVVGKSLEGSSNHPQLGAQVLTLEVAQDLVGVDRLVHGVVVLRITLWAKKLATASAGAIGRLCPLGETGFLLAQLQSKSLVLNLLALPTSL